MSKSLTDRQRAFCHHLVTGITATEAARQAGYSHSYADREAAKLVGKPRVAAYLTELRSEIKNGVIMTTEELQAWWTSVIRDDGTERKDQLKASDLLGKSQGAFIDKVENTHKFDGIVGIRVNLPPGNAE